MFSNYNEAFDNPIETQLKELKKETAYLMKKKELIDNVEQNRNKFGLEPPHVASYYEDPEAKLSIGDSLDYENETFFDAQGGLSYGSDSERRDNLSSLPDPSLDSVFSTDDLSLPSKLSSSNESLYSTPKKKKKGKIYHTHDYYISRFLDEMYQSGGGEVDDQAAVYQHLSTCEFCKSSIKQKIAELTPPGVSMAAPPVTAKPVEVSLKPKEELSGLGKEVKQIVIIIVIGVVIIFLIDLYFRFRSR